MHMVGSLILKLWIGPSPLKARLRYENISPGAFHHLLTRRLSRRACVNTKTLRTETFSSIVIRDLKMYGWWEVGQGTDLSMAQALLVTLRPWSFPIINRSSRDSLWQRRARYNSARSIDFGLAGKRLDC